VDHKKQVTSDKGSACAQGREEGRWLSALTQEKRCHYSQCK